MRHQALVRLASQAFPPPTALFAAVEIHPPGGSDQRLVVLLALGGLQIAVLKRHEDSVYSAAVSPDGTAVITASLDKTARVWDAATGAKIAVLKGYEELVYCRSLLVLDGHAWRQASNSRA